MGVMAALLLGGVAPGLAATIEAEGMAIVTSSGIERARQSALRDAKNQAAMQAGVNVEMTALVNERGLPLESSRIRPAATLEKITILREWQVADAVHVRIAADTDQSGPAQPGLPKYKKKLTATPFHAQKSFQTDDIDDISTGFARELLRRLESSQKFLTKISVYDLTFGSANTSPGQNTEAVKHLARLYESQFVISGTILNAGSSDNGGYFGFFANKKRWLEMEIFIHDGLTGSLIARHKVSHFAEGEAPVGRNKPFASQAFFATRFGQAVDKTLDEVAELVTKDLQALPFAAKVTQVVDDKIYIDAGGTSFVAPGDHLIVYHMERGLPVNGLGPRDNYGTVETPVATVSIVQVQPTFSIAALPASPNNPKIEVGDLVRLEP